MKKILLLGLAAGATETEVHSWLNDFGPVHSVVMVREGDANSPLAIVEMDITDGQAFFLVSRLTSYWHDGALISARLLTH